MATKRVQVEKKKNSKKDEQIEESPLETTSTEELKHDLDDILDEIDLVLEENAEEFVKSYRQKGGE